MKCAFCVTRGTLLGHTIDWDGIIVDPNKVKAVMDAPPPTNAKALSQVLGQIRWHNRIIRYLADFATPLHVVVHRTAFQWLTTKQDAYDCLRKMLSRVPIVQPPDWTKDFHAFVNTSDIAIGSALMQLSEPNWYRQM